MSSEDPPVPILYRCNRCGIESAESSCFVGAARSARQRYAVTCITCSQPSQIRANWRNAYAVLGVIFLPLFFLLGFKKNTGAPFPELVIAACFILPLLMVLHELGHFLTARLLGLQAELITFGIGPKLWSGKILGVPLRIHLWPLLGLTSLGSDRMKLLRLRVWITVFMGPATNVLLIAVPMAFWSPLARVLDPNILILWILYNALLALTNLWPHRIRQSGQRYRTDGMLLLQIPFQKNADLAIYLSSSSIVTAMALFADADYAGARDIAVKALARLPGQPSLSIILSACHISLGDFAAAQTVLDPLLSTTASESPEMRAAIANNLAIAIWLRHWNTSSQQDGTRQAETLSNRAYTKYPCVLPYRATRSLLLTAANRAEEALALLQYSNYDRASAPDRGNCEFARAFALRRLNRQEEAQDALELGLQLSKLRPPWLTTIGLLPEIHNRAPSRMHASPIEPK
jgi:Zn-dependent protease